MEGTKAMEPEPASGNNGTAKHLYITQYQLHKEYGIGKATINRAVKSGRLQLHDREDGVKRVFLPEALKLFQDRVKNEAELVETTQEGNQTASNGTLTELSKLTMELALARQEIAHKEEIIRRIEEHKADIESERDHLRDEVTTLKALPAPAPTPQKPSLWQRLTGAKA